MRIRTAAVIFAGTFFLSSCGDDPVSRDSLPRGAFAGVNTGLLSTLITNTTNVGGDSATGVVVAGDIGASRLSGDAPSQRYFRGLALFSVNGTATSVGAVSANGVALRYRPDAPPSHYSLDTAGSVVLAGDPSVDWLAQWTNGETISGSTSLPPSFGIITLSVGRQMSVAALDAGDSITVSWSGVVPLTRVFIYASWQPEVFAPTLVVAPIPALVVEDAGSIRLPGFNLSRMVRQPNGRLTFVLYRGVYKNIASFDNSTKTLAGFSYVADSVRVELVP